MFNYKKICVSWILMFTLTLVSATFAESSAPSTIALMFICIVTLVKGQLLIDNLMDLRHSVHRIRWMMLAYFYGLLSIIIFAVIFPETVRQITTL